MTELPSDEDAGSSLSPDAEALLGRARSARHAVDLYLAPGATRVLADRLVEVLHRAPARTLGERAVWNLLFAAGELSLQVDVYRAHDLFRGACALVQRVASLDLLPGDERAVAAEMCLDFFFARPSHPLLPLRAREVMATLGALLGSGRRTAVRAAIHGLGHLVGHGLEQPSAQRSFGDDAGILLDEYVATSPDAALLEYAEEARAGTLP